MWRVGADVFTAVRPGMPGPVMRCRRVEAPATSFDLRAGPPPHRVISSKSVTTRSSSRNVEHPRTIWQCGA